MNTPASPPTQAFSPDWDEVRTRVRDHAWATRILEHLREDFERWDGVLEIPGLEVPTEWTHHFFCNDGTPLRFDPADGSVHACPTCGREYAGYPWDGAWRAKVHNLVASQAQRAALLARLGADEAERAAAARSLAVIIGQYATTYGRYQVHGDKVGRGRVMPQNLDESIWIIALLRAVRWAEPMLDGQTLARAEGLAMLVAGLLEPQLSQVHNIHCWIVAALAECAVRSGDQALLERARSGPFGAEQQIKDGFRAEGLWYETSVFYHYYTLGALLSYCEAAGPDGLSADARAMVARGVRVPAQLAYTDGLLPAYGDCWPTPFLDDFAGILAAGQVLLPGHGLESVADAYRDRGVRRRPVDLWIGTRWDADPASQPIPGPFSVAALVFGGVGADTASADTADTGMPSPFPGSFLWPDAGIGVLSSERVRISMRFGPDAGMHEHRDKLAVDVETTGGWRSLDLGSGGYTATFTHWMQSPAAHNIGIIADQRQGKADGVLEDLSPEHLSASVRWDGKHIRRELRLTPDGWTDTMDLTGPRKGPLLWLLHGDGIIVTDSGWPAAEPASPGEIGLAPGLEWYRDVGRFPADAAGNVHVTWNEIGAPAVTLTVPEGAQAFSAVAEGNPTGKPLGVLIVRHENRRTMRVQARFRVGV